MKIYFWNGSEFREIQVLGKRIKLMVIGKLRNTWFYMGGIMTVVYYLIVGLTFLGLVILIPPSIGHAFNRRSDLSFKQLYIEGLLFLVSLVAVFSIISLMIISFSKVFKS